MKKLFIMIFCLVVAAGTASAFNFADHVKVAPNGKGDALIYPFYAALEGGWETKLWVTNTAVDRSVVAKVVWRSMVNTDELLDFFIYLSPTDVWTCTIRWNNGNVEVYSEDDSARISATAFASSANPLRVTISNPHCPDDTNMIGYVEIFEAASTVAGATFGGRSLVNPPVRKTDILGAYDAQAPGMQRETINVLAGHMEFRNLTINQNSTVEATVLRDYDTNEWLTIANETYFGSPAALNDISEVEAALSKNEVAMPYSSSDLTLHFLTFPTKYTQDLDGDCDFTDVLDVPRGVFFQQNGTGDKDAISYLGTDYDKSENSRVVTNIFSPAPGPNQLPNEVNFSTGFSYDEGWTRYYFGPAPNTSYQTTMTNDDGSTGTFWGAPVLPVVVNLGSSNDGYYMFTPGYSDGHVEDAAGNAYYYYQYQDETNINSGPAVGDDYGEIDRAAADGNHPLN